jgi:hypothetical protein
MAFGALGELLFFAGLFSTAPAAFGYLKYRAHLNLVREVLGGYGVEAAKEIAEVTRPQQLIMTRRSRDRRGPPADLPRPGALGGQAISRGGERGWSGS